jgi:pimeloyl-ACP methyl ester carboxylesterase
MKKAPVFLFLVFISVSVFCQGKLVVQKIVAPSIQGNKGGEDPLRQVSVYLPPGYEESKQRYPVIYFLHGYNTDDTEMTSWLQLQQMMDSGIAAGKFRPMIMVLPNSNTKFRGSFYTNSILTGNWADFIARDIVKWTDSNFRTIPDRRSRGLCGHSMGGNGTLKIVMMYPEVFSSAYALSPAVLDWHDDFAIGNSAFKRIGQVNSEKAIINAVDSFFTTWDHTAFFAAAFTAMGRAYSPSEKNMPLQANFPVSYTGDSAMVNMTIMKTWEAQFPMNMIANHLEALRSLTALKMDWGRNENFPHIPFTALQFSRKLETFGVKHFAEEYIGDHGNQIGGFEGRVYTELLPFFDNYLEFDKAPVQRQAMKKLKPKK